MQRARPILLLAMILGGLAFLTGGVAMIRGDRQLKIKNRVADVRSQIRYVDSDHLAELDQEGHIGSMEDIVNALRVMGNGAALNDPFAGNAQLRCSFSPLRIWSVGPDARDNQGLIVYDPTNGVRSRGDIVLHPRRPPRSQNLDSD